MIKIINDSIFQITNFIFINKEFNELTKYDLVIVLGSNYSKEIALEIQKLYENKKINNETLIIISGKKGLLNKNNKHSEAEIIASILKKLGLELNIILEKKAKNIKENLVNSKAIIKSFNKYNRLLIIGKSYVARRVIMCADHLKYPLSKIDYDGIEKDIKKDDWFKTKKSRNRVLAELSRIEKYVKKGDIKL